MGIGVYEPPLPSQTILLARSSYIFIANLFLNSVALIPLGQPVTICLAKSICIQ